MQKKFVFLTILFIIIDQLSKLLIDLNMNLNENIVIINNFFSLNYVHNYGAAFSIFIGARYLFILITIIALMFIYFYLLKGKTLKFYEIFIYALLIGGIIGNLIDRILYGYVLDFLSFKIFNYNFAIFNIADSFIVISIILLIILEVKNAIYSRRRK